MRKVFSLCVMTFLIAESVMGQQDLNTEQQLEKFQQLITADIQLLTDKAKSKGEGGKITATDMDELLKPQVISGNEATEIMKSAELAKPYWFKIRAIYKGFDKNAGRLYLQDINKSSNEEKIVDALLSVVSAAFGVDTTIFSVSNKDEPTKVSEPNTLSTFYCFGVRMIDRDNGENVYDISLVLIDDTENVVLFNKSKFILPSGIHYITVSGTVTQTQENVIMNLLTGGASNSVFDPLKYKLVDLFDARAAMDKKDIRNDFTFPTVPVKYVSEVLFKGQSGTTITISTDDNVLSERMNFTGRVSGVKNGMKVRVYYTIAKDPLEKWEIQAIELL